MVVASRGFPRIDDRIVPKPVAEGTVAEEIRHLSRRRRSSDAPGLDGCRDDPHRGEGEESSTVPRRARRCGRCRIGTQRRGTGYLRAGLDGDGETRAGAAEAGLEPLQSCYPESFERQLGDRVNKRLKSPARAPCAASSLGTAVFQQGVRMAKRNVAAEIKALAQERIPRARRQRGER